ncbi:MAG TPA: type 4a pilus biogenesis protein PilO [Gammaproteobacteria bacterium]|nr:type 4a pilus biogenesis protein PilO [Gammaproteobacteria bacterium]
MPLKDIDLKKIDLRNFYEWPLLARSIIIFLVCVGVFFGGYFFDFSNLSSQIYARYKDEQDLKSQIQSILKIEESMEGSVSQFSELVGMLDSWQAQLISANNIPDLLNQILRLGSQNHVKFILFTPGDKSKKDDYFVMPIKAIVLGNYQQLASFISQLANLPQIVVINNLSIASTAEKDKSDNGEAANQLTAGLDLEVYYLANYKK